MKQTRYYEFPLAFKEKLYQFEENLAKDYSVYNGEITVIQHFITLTGFVGIVIEINENFDIIKNAKDAFLDEKRFSRAKYMRLHEKREIYINRSLESIINEQYLELLEE